MKKPAIQGPTRDRLVQAAVELFYAHGYAATGMADILKRAQANSGSFYFFFKSKEDLLLAVLDWYRQHLDPVLLAPVCAQTPDPVEQIFALLDFYRANILRTDFGFGCPLGRLALEIDPDRRKVHAGIAANFDGWKSAIAERVRLAAPRFAAGTDPAQVASLVLSVMEGAVMQSRSYRQIEPFDQSVAALRDYFHRITAKKSSRAPKKSKETS
jgi:AcrR family transcriptional regulator